MCYYINDEIAGKVLIPECWGTVHSNDMDDCYCDIFKQRKTKLEKLEAKIKRLENKVKKLEYENSQSR